MPETFVLITGRGTAAGAGGRSPSSCGPRPPGAHPHPARPRDGDDPRRHSLDDVADFIVALVGAHDLVDVTMVAHSWGGYPMTGAAHRLAPACAS
jgi:pimeloyl-ACP methyl ester carboxylesterase